jgi:hypothetical protein
VVVRSVPVCSLVLEALSSPVDLVLCLLVS